MKIMIATLIISHIKITRIIEALEKRIKIKGHRRYYIALFHIDE